MSVIAELSACLCRMRALAPFADLVVVASPEAHAQLQQELGMNDVAGPAVRLLGLEVLTRADAPPGKLYVMERRFA